MGENLETTRRSRRSGQTVSPFLYGIWFPSPAVLKIGCTSNRAQAVYVSSARQGACARGWNADDASRIWHEPEDERTEAFLQAVLAFEWPCACAGRQLRLSEWFRPNVGLEKIVDRLAEVHRPGTTGPPGAPAVVLTSRSV